MKKYSFTKMNGAGNDFIIFDRGKNANLVFTADSIRKICDRKRGIGADGLMTYSSLLNSDFELEFYNADGLAGSLCGNGARCALEYHRSEGGKENKNVSFLFNGKNYSGLIFGARDVEFHLAPPEKIKLNFKVKAGSQMITAHFADTGSPHVVIEANQIMRNAEKPAEGYFSSPDELNVAELGSEIRHLPEFKPGGVNVNFVTLENGVLNIRTFERGVEAETLACGTGSVAAALIFSLLKKVQSPVALKTRGGDFLSVSFINPQDNMFENISLRGPAVINYTGQISNEFFI